MLTINATVYLLTVYSIVYIMSTPVAGPSHLPHPSPAPGQQPYDQKRRQESDDTRRAYVLYIAVLFHADV